MTAPQQGHWLNLQTVGWHSLPPELRLVLCPTGRPPGCAAAPPSPQSPRPLPPISVRTFASSEVRSGLFLQGALSQCVTPMTPF